jgi:hypothetical protein
MYSCWSHTAAQYRWRGRARSDLSLSVLQEEERERRMDFIPEESAVNTDSIEVDRDTLDMLKSINMGSLPGVSAPQVRSNTSAGR